MLIGMSILAYLMVEMMYKYISREGQDLMRIFIISIAGLIIGGIGAGLGVTMYLGYDTVQDFKEEDYSITESTILMDDKVVFSENDSIAYSYRIDDSAKDIKVEIKAINGVNCALDYNYAPQWREYYSIQNFKLIDMYKLVLSDLKEEQLRDYKKVKYAEIIIITSRDNYNKLRENYREFNK
jgi:hypothetical protein